MSKSKNEKVDFFLASEIGPPDPDVLRARESGYRRGFTHGMTALAEAMGLKGDDRFQDALWLALEMRFDREPHPLYTQEFSRRFRGLGGGE